MEVPTGLEARFIVQVCKVDGCTKRATHHASGECCQKHGGRCKCSQEGCLNFAHCRGVCASHGAPKYKRKTCSAEGCMKQSVQNGYCEKHGGAENSKLCIFDSCNHAVHSKQMCYKHAKSTSDPDVAATHQVADPMDIFLKAVEMRMGGGTEPGMEEEKDVAVAAARGDEEDIEEEEDDSTASNLLSKPGSNEFGEGGDREVLEAMVEGVEASGMGGSVSAANPPDMEGEARDSTMELMCPLTDEEMMVVEKAQAKGSPSEILAKHDADSVQRSSMWTLRPKKWLNCLAIRDEKICAGDKGRKHSHFFSTYFIQHMFDQENKDPKVKGIYNYKMVEKWSKKLEGSMEYVKDEYRAKNDKELDVTKWELVSCAMTVVYSHACLMTLSRRTVRSFSIRITLINVGKESPCLS
ncbi:hypothetical protein ACHAW5_005529 [Stephanodiscus triporus]|uniref:Uncharacterized protein n=1 Tax=Stephanodiscus triporus TaxID=2934178 RepID=A0ABD3NJC6_9STRA